MLGCFIFLFGMVAFNAGSQGAISRPGDGMEIAKVSINSLICTMSGGLTALLYDRYAVEGNRSKNWNYSSCITGTFVGMVSSFFLLKNHSFYRLINDVGDYMRRMRSIPVLGIVCRRCIELLLLPDDPARSGKIKRQNDNLFIKIKSILFLKSVLIFS